MTAPRTLLGDSEVLHAIKSGGMGDVLLARRRGAGGFEQLCAVKTIRGELAAAPVARTMFLDEAKLLARLTHPGIAQILDFGEQDGTLYMIMEYVPGQHFRRFGERRPPPAIVCAAMAAACRGLHAAHELRDLGDGHLLGVVHRDVSPDNLMLGFDARVKVLDFGIALVKGRQAPVTEFGVLKGKPPYMSPEQVKNQALDRRADVFSTCVVLHELLSGEALFRGDSIYAIARAVEHQEILPPSHWCGPLPRDLDDVVMAGLERDRDRRLATAAALAEVLERIASAEAKESLESWADRELAGEREQHRVWLARILAASGPMKATAGRATGMVTAVGESGAIVTGAETEGGDGGRAAEIGVAATVADTGQRRAARVLDAATPAGLHERVTEAGVGGGEGGAGTTTRGGAIDGTTDIVVGPRRRGAVVIVLVVLGLLGVLAALLLLGGRGDGARQVADASEVVVPVDALVAVPVDAAAGDADVPPADAAFEDDRDGGRGPRRRDAGSASPIDAGPTVRTIDAAVAALPPDDAAVAAVTGTGFLTCTADPFALVSVDGEDYGTTPFFKRKIAAGKHEVVFTSPAANGAVVKRKTVDIKPGQTVTVTAP